MTLCQVNLGLVIIYRAILTYYEQIRVLLGIMILCQTKMNKTLAIFDSSCPSGPIPCDVVATAL